MSFDNELSSKNGSLGLPPEILVEIFALCLPTDRVRLSKHPQLLPPFTLARVCSYWRRLVISSPRLWSRIVLGRHGSDSSEELRTLDLWLECVGRSKPLEIVLDPQIDDVLEVLSNDEAYAKYESATTTLIEKLCANSRRWRSLDLGVLHGAVLGPLFATLSTLELSSLARAPLLEELELTATMLGGAEDIRTLHNFAINCPGLRSLTLTCPTLLPTPTGAQNTTFLCNMRVLKLRYCTTVSHALDWLDICPNLEYLKVHLLCGPNQEDDDPEIDEFDGLDEEIEPDELDGDGWVVVENRPRVRMDTASRDVRSVKSGNVRVLRDLTQLEIVAFTSPVPVGTLLDALSAPSLRSLKVSSFHPRAISVNNRWLHVPLFLRRSGTPPLEGLEINGVPMNIDDMRACLALAPRLRNLTIGRFEELDDLLREMTAQPGQSGADSLICPLLEKLDITGVSFAIDNLATMVSSRFISGRSNMSEKAGLKELCVHENAEEKIGYHPVIERCISEGLKVTKADPLLSFRVD